MTDIRDEVAAALFEAESRPLTWPDGPVPPYEGILRIVMAVFGCRCCGHTRWFHRSWTVSTMLACHHGDCRCVDYVTSLWDRGVA